MKKKWNPIWPFTEEQRVINRCSMSGLARNRGPRRLLRVETEYFTAGAVFEKIFGLWSCTQAAPIIRWMVGKDVMAIKVALLKMAARYEWVAPSPMPAAQTAQAGQSLPARGEVYHEAQRPLAPATVDLLSTAACASDRPETGATTGGTPAAGSLRTRPKPSAQPVPGQTARTSESASVSTLVCNHA